MADVIAEIAAERLRQQEREGYDVAHDDTHRRGEMAASAAAYAAQAAGLGFAAWNLYPFGSCAWKPKDARRNLVIAAALAVAEIERLDRATAHDAALDAAYPEPA